MAEEATGPKAGAAKKAAAAKRAVASKKAASSTKATGKKAAPKAKAAAPRASARTSASPSASAPPSASASNGTVRVSVVVPTCSRSERMMRLLDALAAQDIGELFEVVVVDDVSKDDTVGRLRAAAPSQPFSLVVVESEVNTGPAGARNRGWRKAKGELIAFVDDDCVPDPGWLREITDAMDDGGDAGNGGGPADITVGRTRPPEDQLHLIGPFSSYLDLEHNRSFSTCNVAYRRQVLERMDGFDEVNFRYPNGEDTDLGLRAVKAGYRDVYVPGALMWHDVGPSTFKAHLHRIPRMDGLVALVKLHPEAREIMGCGWFLRSVDKAVFIAWAATLGLLLRPRLASTRLFAAIAAVLYVWQYRKWHYDARSTTELLTAIPQAFVADSWAVMVMIRSSARHRALLL
jgi:GT2 family glycosyltransferase